MDLYIIRKKFAVRTADCSNEWVWLFQDYTKAKAYYSNLVADLKKKDDYKMNEDECFFSMDGDYSVLQFVCNDDIHYINLTLSPIRTID